MAGIHCVVPTVRQERMQEFRNAWGGLFERHGVHLTVVNDGEHPYLQHYTPDGNLHGEYLASSLVTGTDRELFCHHTDAVRNYGFLALAKSADKPDYVLTLDDDVHPLAGDDPILAHKSVLGQPCSGTWLNTAPSPPWPYFRGVPYHVRRESKVMLSHGVWCGVPDYDAPTQLTGGESLPRDLPYYVGPVPWGTLFPLCGMNVMVARDALPYFYFAPMGPDAYNLNRFADIWMGVALKVAFDRRGWTCYTGAAKVVHTRASDVYKNLAHEAEGLRHNEHYLDVLLPKDESHPYFHEYKEKRQRYKLLIAGLLEGTSGT